MKLKEKCIFLGLGNYGGKQTKEFIRFLKGLDEKQQMGLHLTIEGLQVLFEKQKKRHENR